jgi:hypothetical protein
VKPELREPRLSRIERRAECAAFSPGERLLTKAATNEASCFMAFEVPSAGRLGFRVLGVFRVLVFF